MASYRLKNREEVNLKSKIYRDKNKDKYKIAILRWKKENHKIMIQKQVEREKERRKTDKFFAFKKDLKRKITKSLQKNNYQRSEKIEQILGCTYDFFINHIEKQFLKGMTWENRKDWHLDHIIPISTALCCDDVIKLNHFTNLRPIWAKDNLKKSNKLIFIL